MKTVLKWAGIVVGGLVGVIIVAVIVLYLLGSSRVGKTYDIQVESIAVPSGPEAVERGRHYVEAIVACGICHGDNLEGDILSEDPLFATLAAPNLTSGLGGIGSTYTDIDYVRTIRHGVKPDGTSVVLMPSQHFNRIGDDDLGAMIAYFKSMPPIDNELPATSLGPLGRIIALLDSAPLALLARVGVELD